MDAFAAMAGQLQAEPRQPKQQQENTCSKAARLRQHLQDTGRSTARELAAATGLRDTGLVSALLKHDIQRGRVRIFDGQYEWHNDAQEGAAAALPPALIARAFQIADEAMYELLESEGVPGDEHRTVFGFCDESCQEVSSLAEASPAMQEAFDWLHMRGYVELGTDGEGQFVNVIRRPGEE